MNSKTSPAKPANHHNSAHRKLAKVLGDSDGAMRMELVIRRHADATGNDRFSATARLPLPGRDIHATAVHADLYTAIVLMIGRLVRRSRSGKTHLRNNRAPRPATKTEDRRAVPQLLSGGASPAGSTHALRQADTLNERTNSKVMVTDGPRDSVPHLVLAIDLAKTANAVARTGAELAGKLGARLTLVHVLEPVPLESDIAAYWAGFPEQRRHNALARLQSWSRREAGIANAECRVMEGRPWEEVVRFTTANQADLIVMGRSGESRWFGQFTARTVERVVQHSPCPVWMVGQDNERGPRELRKVLLTTDFSAESLDAFPWGDRLARMYGVHLLLANVQDPMGLPGTVEYSRFHPEIDALRDEADTKLESWKEAHLAADLRVKTRVVEGEPAAALCRLAEASQTDLIVMSAHGTKGWVRKWLGGTTERVLRNATCSVLVVPHRQPTTARLGLDPTAPVSIASWDTQWTAWRHHRPNHRTYSKASLESTHDADAK